MPSGPSGLSSTLLVALGGAAGSAARYLVSQALASRSFNFPVATLAINGAGSFVLGLVLARAAHRSSATVLLLVGVGACGGFTTFSAFSAEVVALAARGAVGRAAAYVTLSLAAGLLAVLAGLTLGRALAAR